MKKLQMSKARTITFEQGCNMYLDNCRQRNLRDGTINHYTDQYNDLQAVRRDYPNFKVVTNKTANKSNGFKGLTLEYMENYIKGHDTDNEIMSEFNILCGKDQDGNKVEFAESASYGEIKKWFLNTYPQIKEYHNKLENILKKSA